MRNRKYDSVREEIKHLMREILSIVYALMLYALMLYALMLYALMLHAGDLTRDNQKEDASVHMVRRATRTHQYTWLDGQPEHIGTHD